MAEAPKRIPPKVAPAIRPEGGWEVVLEQSTLSYPSSQKHLEACLSWSKPQIPFPEQSWLSTIGHSTDRNVRRHYDVQIRSKIQELYTYPLDNQQNSKNRLRKHTCQPVYIGRIRERFPCNTVWSNVELTSSIKAETLASVGPPSGKKPLAQRNTIEKVLNKQVI